MGKVEDIRTPQTGADMVAVGEWVDCTGDCNTLGGTKAGSVGRAFGVDWWVVWPRAKLGRGRVFFVPWGLQGRWRLFLGPGVPLQ